MKRIIVLGIVCFITSCGVTSKSIKISTPEYSSNIDVYSASDTKKQNKKLAFINLHPKGGNGRQHSGVVDTALALSDAGYTAYVPDMPYYGYSGTLTDAFKLIDKLAEQASKDGKQVIITGHSMGAAVAFLYASAYKPHKSVIGVVLMAPGHMLQLSSRIQDATALDVQRARKLVKNGKDKERGSFYDFNQGSKFLITTTPMVYLSYFDPREFPNPATHLDALKVPMLWIDGEHDLGAARHGFENLFDRANKYTKYPQNKYRVVSAGHKEVPAESSDIILQWVEQFKK